MPKTLMTLAHQLTEAGLKDVRLTMDSEGGIECTATAPDGQKITYKSPATGKPLTEDFVYRVLMVAMGRPVRS